MDHCHYHRHRRSHQAMMTHSRLTFRVHGQVAGADQSKAELIIFLSAILSVLFSYFAPFSNLFPQLLQLFALPRFAFCSAIE